MRRIRLERWHERLAASLWFFPGVAVVIAVAAAQLLVELDRQLDPSRTGWFLFGASDESARVLLSTIASSMITLTALVFSITILVLQLASGQFSPRVLRTFLADRTTKLAMAAFVGTFVYALALLPKIRGDGEQVSLFVPALSVFVAFALVLASVGVFVQYINHMANAVRAITIIKHISRETRAQIEELYPDELAAAPALPSPLPDAAPTVVVMHRGQAGIVYAVDQALLAELASRSRTIIAVVPRHGDFVPSGAPLFRIWGPTSFDVEELHAAVLIDDERTLHQDALFGFRQLVDIAERALSPGINDPSTAVQVIDEIHDLLRLLASRELPSPLRLDEAGELRLILPRPDWNTYVRMGIDEIRQYGGTSVQVARRLRALLDDLLSITHVSRRAILDEQRRLLDESIGRDIPSPRDREIARSPSMQGHGQA